MEDPWDVLVMGIICAISGFVAIRFPRELARAFFFPEWFSAVYPPAGWIMVFVGGWQISKSGWYLMEHSMRSQ